MLANINSRLLLLITPIAFGTFIDSLTSTTETSLLASQASNRIVAWFLAACASCVLPNKNRFWMILGATASFFTLENIIQLIQPRFITSYLLSAFVAPFITATFAPKLNKLKRYHRRWTSYLLNYTLATIFLVLTSLLTGAIFAYLFRHVCYWINQVSLSSVFDPNFSFLYSSLYQLCQLFGFGYVVSEIKDILSTNSTTVSFYATTLIINTGVLPAMYAALFYQQPQKRKLIYGLFTIVAFTSCTTGTSVSALLFCLLWLYPSLFVLYLLLCIAFYFIGQYIEFFLVFMPDALFYEKTEVVEYAFSDSKFKLYYVFAFIVTVFVTTYLIKQDRKYQKQLTITSVKRIKQISINIVLPDDSNTLDCSLTAVNYVMLLGGYNNIFSMRQQDKIIKVNIINLDMVNYNELIKLGLLPEGFTANSHIIALKCGDQAYEIAQKISVLGKRQFVDLMVDYRDVPPYQIEKSKYYVQFSK